MPAIGRMHQSLQHVTMQQQVQHRCAAGRPRHAAGCTKRVQRHCHLLPLRALPVFDLSAVLPLRGAWGIWSGLVCAGAFGLWSEKTRLGKELSGALVATLAGMVLVNVGVLPPDAAQLKVVYHYLLPLAIPLLLLTANLRRVLFDTGRLLPAFLLGSACTVLGSAVAMLCCPLGNWLGQDGWKVAAALTARHIGGAVNYMGVSETLSLQPSTFGAGLAADDLILTLYFTAIYALARKIPPEGQLAGAGAAAGSPIVVSSAASGDATAAVAAAPSLHGASEGKGVQVYEGMLALSLSTLVCAVGTAAARHLAMPTQTITFITLLTVCLATALPKLLAPLAPSANGLAQILMQVFYATIGASANVRLVVQSAPILFVYSAVALAVHLGALLAVGKLLGFSQRDLLLASNANIGGPSTVAGMASSKGWTSVVVPSILCATLGYAIGSVIGLSLGHTMLRHV